MSVACAVGFVREYTAAAKKPWLVVGKGPTSDFLCRVDTDQYHVLTLNHAVRAVTPVIAHFVDVDALLACRHLLSYLPDTRVAMPWHPHEHYKASPTPLDEFPWAGEFGGRLLSYNATTANNKVRNRELPVLRLRYFSAVAAFNVLIAAGVKEIHSLGVDGGVGYGQAFDQKTRLANGQRTFDVQFPEIKNTTKRNGVRWTRLCVADDTEGRAPDPAPPPPHRQRPPA